MTAVFARIILRYVAGALVTAGYLDSTLGNQMGMDPDLIMLVGAGLGIAVEFTYAIVKKVGGKT